MYKYKCVHVIRLVDLKDLVKEDLKVDLILTQLRSAKLMTIAKFQGDLKEEYGMLWDYVGEIERSKLGSTIEIKVQRLISEQLPFFERLYISFDCLKKGFLGGCRRILRLDSCFLKGTVKGKILATVGSDGNNQMFPIAWSVVTCKNRVT